MTVAARVDRIDWNRVAADLHAGGWALLSGMLHAEECDVLAELYAQDAAAVASSWPSTATGAGNTSTFRTRCPSPSPAFVPRSIRA